MPLTEKEIYEFGPFSVDPTERVMFRDGTLVPLTPKVFDTLVYLVRNRGRLLTKDELLKEIWPKTFVEEVNLAVNISVLRKVFGEGPQDCRYIATIPGSGYRFVAEVRKATTNNEDEQNSITLNGSAMASPVHSTVIERGSAEPEHEESNGTSQFVVTRSSPKKNRSWNVTVSIGIALLLAAALCAYVLLGQRKKNASTAAVPSIAVLAFTDLSGGQDQEYFCDGLAEELINYFAKIPGVRVVARSSSFQFKGKNEDLRAVGKKLGVTNILEGSLQREGDHVRIMAELVKADDGFQLWSETYDRQIGDIFSVQDEIARSVTGALQVNLLGAKGLALSAHSRSTNPKAYEAYLRAGYFNSRGRGKAELDNALAYIEQAVKLDPQYAPAWELRSYIFDTMADVGLIEPAVGFRRAREDAERAIALDSNRAAGYLALAWVQMNRDWNWEGAELSLNKAAELEPGSAAVLRLRSFLCQSRGQLNEAIEFNKQALALDPLLAGSHSYMAFLYYAAGQYENAEDEVQKALELNPQKTYDHFSRGEILLARRRPLEALTEMEQEPAEIWRLTGEALAYQALGRTGDSNAALSQLIADHQTNMAYQIAQVYAYRGEPDKAFQWLGRAYEQHDAGLRSLKIDPHMNSLRRDQRYRELLKAMNLPT
jgi:TolB-like protein/DNA-binding winged helix-turn-helix (wHTH) protein/Tfp pilus assembly protein PilF